MKRKLMDPTQIDKITMGKSISNNQMFEYLGPRHYNKKPEVKVEHFSKMKMQANNTLRQG